MANVLHRYEFFDRCKTKAIRIARYARSPYQRLEDDTDSLRLELSSYQKEQIRSPFRFLELPPELRVHIYENLLLNKVKHPHILATCKKINHEASHILYERNQIIIDISPDAVRTYGVRCGKHVPVQCPTSSTIKAADFTTIVWPEFLRRVRHICIVSQETWYRAGSDPAISIPISHGVRTTAICNALYSLCTNLRGKHHEMLMMEAAIKFQTLEDMRTSLYPMRWLEFNNAYASRQNRTPICTFFDRYAYFAVSTLRSDDRKSKIDILRVVQAVLKAVVDGRPCSSVSKFTGSAVVNAMLALAGVAGVVDRDTGGHCYDSARALTNFIKHAVREIRIWLEMIDISMMRIGLQAGVMFILRLDVELRCTPTIGKREDAVRNARLTGYQMRARQVVALTDGRLESEKICR